MHSPISNLALAVGIHGLKNKTLINKLETYWVNEELAAHGRYSPFMLEVQKTQDLKANFWSLSIFVLFVLVDGLILCACSHWLDSMRWHCCLFTGHFHDQQYRGSYLAFL